MAYTTAQRTALESALVSGELEIEVEGRRVRYRSTAEIERALAIIDEDIAKAAGRRRRKYTRVNVRKGVL